MPIPSQTVPIQPSPFAATLREDDFNAALVRLPIDRPLALANLHDGASRDVRWPQDGGRILRAAAPSPGKARARCTSTSASTTTCTCSCRPATSCW